MNEFEEFTNILDKIECSYEILSFFWPMGESSPKPRVVVSVGQSHFFFDDDNRYMGVEWDEMGNFTARGEDDV